MLFNRLIEIEGEIMKSTNFEISTPTAIHFLDAYMLNTDFDPQ